MLEKSVPSTGLICVAIARGSGFAHRFFEDYPTAHAYALRQDARGEVVYMGQSTFKTDENRKQANVAAVRAFWMDIDCGEGKPYANQTEGILAIRQFVIDSGLPVPSVVRSGGGLYAYWCMTEDIAPSQWRMVAQYLKTTAFAYNLQIDPTRTADSASVLRPIGTTNRKIEGLDRPVVLYKDAPTLDFIEFVRLLGVAGKRKGLGKERAIKQRPSTAPNSDYHVHDSAPVNAQRIADKCAQIWKIRETRGNVDEPFWYAAIGLLRYADDQNLIHEWSSGHPEYTPEDTEAKKAQHEAAGIGPTTCLHFAAVNPRGCVGCKHKIRSPILLGREAPEAMAPPPVETRTDDPTQVEPEVFIQPAEGFTVSEQGLYYKNGDLNVCFYDRPLYPVRVSYDEGLGYETLTLRHHSAHDGVNDFTIRTAVTHDTKALMQVLADNHVLVCGHEEKKIMGVFIESYAQRLQRQRKLVRLMSQMGWKDINGSPAFVWGKTIFYADGTVDVASLASNVPAVAAAFTTKGELAPWVDATEVLGKPGMQPYAFALLAGAFGAPVFKFTGFEGAMISLVGQTGIGKTLITRWAQSAYGDQSKLLMLRDDTRNSLISRLGLYGSLPLTIDEVTNIDPAELSDLVYRVTQGRDKARLTKNAVERTNINHWNTLALVSTNSSLVDKLSGLKADASAEINRVFEYSVEGNEHFPRTVATDVFRTISDNYGHAGETYLRYLVTNTEKHQANIDKLAAIIDERAKLRSEERYWSALVASAIYGGMVARKLGLVKFEITPVMEWAISQLVKVAETKRDVVTGPIDVLGVFLDEHSPNRIVVRSDSLRNAMIVQEPRGPLVVRMDINDRYAYISRSTLRSWCTRKHVSYSSLRDTLLSAGILKEVDARRNLGAGTNFSGTSQPCWKIDVQAPALGVIALVIQEEMRELKKGVK